MKLEKQKMELLSIKLYVFQVRDLTASSADIAAG